MMTRLAGTTFVEARRIAIDIIATVVTAAGFEALLQIVASV